MEEDTLTMGVNLQSEAPQKPADVLFNHGLLDPLFGLGLFNSSIVARRPTLVTITGLGAGDTAQVRVKTEPSGAFVDFGALIDGSVNTEALIEFLQPYNFLEVVLAGTSVALEAEITTVDDVSGSLGGTFFDFWVAAGTGAVVAPVKFRFWFDVSGGNVAPVPEGATLVEVDIVTDDGATAVAVALAAAMDAQTNLGASSIFDDVTAANVIASPVPKPRDSELKPTGFSFAFNALGGLDGRFVQAQLAGITT